MANMSNFDITQLGRRKRVAGYPSLAEKMGTAPQHSILRRFSAIGMQNLLYYQAELVYLEERLRKIEAQSSAQGDGTQQYQYARDWEELKNSSDNRDWKTNDGETVTLMSSCLSSTASKDTDDIPIGVNGEQLQLVLRLRIILKKYCMFGFALLAKKMKKTKKKYTLDTAVLQHLSITSLPDPGAQDLNHLRQWLADANGGNYSLDGIDSDLWDTSDDLFALRERPDTDKLSDWVVQDFLPRYHKHIGRLFKKPDPNGDSSVIYTESYFLSACVTVLSSILIIVPVIVLHAVEAMNTRLALLALFTAIFSLCVTALTNARRNDVLVATATFAAVQVVFIGTSGSSSA